MKCLAYFVDKLKSTPEGDGTLLDHSLILYGTNMGDSNQHLHYDVPHILVGGASGQLKGDRHLAYPTKTVTTGNLLLSILDMYGIHKDSIGDSTGRLPDWCWSSHNDRMRVDTCRRWWLAAAVPEALRREQAARSPMRP